MTTQTRLAALLSLLLALSAPPAPCAETDALTRDPSRIVQRGGTYWLYGTGRGIRQFSSTDRRHWADRGPVFPQAPAWVASAVPANRDNGVWAPDVLFWGGKYHLYFCYSTFGSNVSAIGLATSATLDPRQWADQGLVLRTGPGAPLPALNALDPCPFLDAQGRPWLSFGSYFGGISVIPLDPATGKPAPGARPALVASHQDAPGNPIEASYVAYHDGWYYLFVNWGSCCAGPRSTYNIRVGRSRDPDGPYGTQDGRDMARGGGTLLLGSVWDDGSGRPPDDEVGPGHAGIFHDVEGDWLSFHEEWARDRGGATTVNLLRLAWDSGWLQPVLDPGPWRVVSALSTHDALDAANGKAGLQTWFFTDSPAQRWTLRFQPSGFYALYSADGRALGASGDPAKPGARLTLAPFRGQDAQLWSVRQNDDGTDTILCKAGGLALDVSGCSPADGVPVHLWTPNGLPCQRWSFRAR